jgi:hypothetical protein
MPRRAVETLITELRWLNGRLNSLHSVQKSPRWLPMKHSSTTFKNDSPDRFAIPMGPFALGHPRDHGMAETNGADTKIVNGSKDGVRSRSPNVFESTFPRTRR